MYLTLKPYPMTLVLWFNCFILSTPSDFLIFRCFVILCYFVIINLYKNYVIIIIILFN